MVAKNSKNAAINKIAQVGLVFWVLKILTTILAVTSGGILLVFLSFEQVSAPMVITGLTVLLVGLQLLTKTFHALVFWAAIFVCAIAGIYLSAWVTQTVGQSYIASAALLFGVGLLTLFTWWATYGTLVVKPIKRGGREAMFWVAVLISSSLGTALSSVLTQTYGLSYVIGTGCVATVLGGLLALHRFTKINPVTLFWPGFIFVQALGVISAGFLTAPLTAQGVNLSADLVSIGALAATAAVLLLTILPSKMTPKTA